MNEIYYDIHQFYWNKEANTFTADAWDLMATLPDGTIHPESFPNGKRQFIIKNYATEGFRRFEFVSEEKSFYQFESTGDVYECIDWVFKSEDGILCSICIKP